MQYFLYQTGGSQSFSSGYPNTEKWVKKRGRAIFFNPLRGVWLLHETLDFRVFENEENEGIKSSKSMLIKISVPNHRHAYDLKCL